jgi:drug/metabolite transporter (DMT)-like permease
VERRALVEIHSAVFLFGLAGLFGKLLSFSPLLIVLGRVFFAGITLGLIIFFSSLNWRVKTKNDLFLLLSLGPLLAIHWGAFFQSIQVSSVTIGLLSYSTFPVFTVFFEPWLFREKIKRRNIALALLCLFGVYLIIPQFDWHQADFQGVLWGIFSGFTFALLTIFNRRLSQKYSSLLIAFYQDTVATVALLPCLLWISFPLSLRTLGLLFFLGTACTALAHTLFIKGMQLIRAQKAAIISSLEPVYGIILAFALLGETPSLRTIIGGLIILAATITVSALKEEPSISHPGGFA